MRRHIAQRGNRALLGGSRFVLRVESPSVPTRRHLRHVADRAQPGFERVTGDRRRHFEREGSARMLRRRGCQFVEDLLAVRVEHLRARHEPQRSHSSRAIRSRGSAPKTRCTSARTRRASSSVSNNHTRRVHPSGKSAPTPCSVNFGMRPTAFRSAALVSRPRSSTTLNRNCVTSYGARTRSTCSRCCPVVEVEHSADALATRDATGRGRVIVLD